MVNVAAVVEHVVRQSASMLDRVSPDWWTPERVNLDTLDITSGFYCLLAQSFGIVEFECSCCSSHSYGAGLDRVLELASDACLIEEDYDRFDFSADHGFSGGYVSVDREIFPDSESDRVFILTGLLTAPWIKVITERRDAANDPLRQLLNA